MANRTSIIISSKKKQSVGAIVLGGGNVLRELFRRFIVALKKLFGRQPSQIGLPDSDVASELYSPEAKKRFKIIGPNMPKMQPCPICHAGLPRAGRTRGGARYNCRRHGVFFVAASKRIRGYS